MIKLVAQIDGANLWFIKGAILSWRIQHLEGKTRNLLVEIMSSAGINVYNIVSSITVLFETEYNQSELELERHPSWWNIVQYHAPSMCYSFHQEGKAHWTLYHTLINSLHRKLFNIFCITVWNSSANNVHFINL